MAYFAKLVGAKHFNLDGLVFEHNEEKQVSKSQFNYLKNVSTKDLVVNGNKANVVEVFTFEVRETYEDDGIPDVVKEPVDEDKPKRPRKPKDSDLVEPV